MSKQTQTYTRAPLDRLPKSKALLDAVRRQLVLPTSACCHLAEGRVAFVCIHCTLLARCFECARAHVATHPDHLQRQCYECGSPGHLDLLSTVAKTPVSGKFRDVVLGDVAVCGVCSGKTPRTRGGRFMTMPYTTDACNAPVVVTLRRGDLALLSDGLELLMGEDGSWIHDGGDLEAFQTRVERLREHIDGLVAPE